MAPHTLITIRLSHFNEKARWALDRAAVAYRERPYMPMFHMPAVAWATRGGASGGPGATRFSTPLLVTSGGEVIHDSEKIVRFADRHAAPGMSLLTSPEAETLATRFHEQLFVHTRRVVYHELLPQTELIHALADHNTPGWQAWMGRLIVPVVRPLMRRGMNITPATAARSLARVETVVADVEQLLADGRRYLADDRFSVADLNFACGLAPFLWLSLEQGYGAWFPDVDALGPRLAELVLRFRDRPAGRFATRMFTEERGKRLLPIG